MNKEELLKKEVGGSHYNTLGMQPVELCSEAGFDFFQGSVLKYVTRHKTKNGAEDIKKAIHFAEFGDSMSYNSADGGLSNGDYQFLAGEYTRANRMGPLESTVVRNLYEREFPAIKCLLEQILKRDYHE